MSLLNDYLYRLDEVARLLKEEAERLTVTHDTIFKDRSNAYHEVATMRGRLEERTAECAKAQNDMLRLIGEHNQLKVENTRLTNELRDAKFESAEVHRVLGGDYSYPMHGTAYALLADIRSKKMFGRQRDAAYSVLLAMAQRSTPDGPCWCPTWPDEEGSSHKHALHCTAARALLADAEADSVAKAQADLADFKVPKSPCEHIVQGVSGNCMLCNSNSAKGRES